MIGTNIFDIAVPNPAIMLFTAVYAALPLGNAPRKTLPRYKAMPKPKMANIANSTMFSVSLLHFPIPSPIKA